MNTGSGKLLAVAVAFGCLVVCFILFDANISSAESGNSFSDETVVIEKFIKAMGEDVDSTSLSFLPDDELQEEFDIEAYSNRTKKTKKKRRIKTPQDANLPDSAPVGPDLRGSWSGFIDLIGAERESVTATVHQNGNYIVITTSSHQKYGRKFIGNIKDSGFILAYDQSTGEDWTTHSGPATENRIDLYDYVNIQKYGYRKLDRLLLER